MSSVVNRATGQSKGFAFVQMESNRAAREALSGVNGTVIDGRTLRVSEARGRTERSSSRSGSRLRRDDRSGGKCW